MNDGKVSKRFQNVLLFISPKCRSGNKSLETISNLLSQNGYRVLNDPYEDIDPNTIIMREKDSAEVVMVGGGDGSVNFVLPSLIKTKIPLLVIPLGTANNLARSYELPRKFEDIVGLLNVSNVEVIDVGVVNEIPYVNVAGLGLSTEINRKVSPGLKKFFGVFAFIITGLSLIFRLNPFRSKIIIPGKEPRNSKSWQISVCNGKHYGSGMVVKHDATHDDEVLHLLSTEVKKWWNGITLIPALLTGHYNSNHEISLLEGREFRIETRRKLMIDVDGDIKTSTPADFKVLPKALKLLTP